MADWKGSNDPEDNERWDGTDDGVPSMPDPKTFGPEYWMWRIAPARCLRKNAKGVGYCGLLLRLDWRRNPLTKELDPVAVCPAGHVEEL